MMVPANVGRTASIHIWGVSDLSSAGTKWLSTSNLTLAALAMTSRHVGFVPILLYLRPLSETR
jgi:hypothetical protein